jgi:hypothetical protein
MKGMLTGSVNGCDVHLRKLCVFNYDWNGKGLLPGIRISYVRDLAFICREEGGLHATCAACRYDKT